MDYEASLNQALDLLADGEDRKAERALQAIINEIKAHLTGDDADMHRYYYWGRCLTAMEEVEQALLKFEKVLGMDATHEGALWETASIFFHDLDRPESAQPILKDKLLVHFPDNDLYQESLRAVEFALRLRKSPPPSAQAEPSAADAFFPDDAADIPDAPA